MRPDGVSLAFEAAFLITLKAEADEDSIAKSPPGVIQEIAGARKTQMEMPTGNSPPPCPAASKRLHFDSLTQEAYLNLWRTYDRLKAIEESLFEQFGISAQQYNTLRLLESVHPASMQTLDLRSRLVSRAPDMTRLLDKLQERGLVERDRRAENRRVIDVRISEKGIELLDQLAGQVIECHQKQLGHLSEGQLREFIRLLQLGREPHEVDATRWLVTGD
jgi:DNA-binding MarR family transcriptional regulator